MMKIKYLYICIIVAFIVSCAGAKVAEGPAYRENGYLVSGAGKVILYSPESSRIKSYARETEVFVNTKKISAIHPGGYHEYYMKPGIHLVTVRNEDRNFEENVVLNAEAGKTTYLKFSYHLEEIEYERAKISLMSTRREFQNTKPFSAFDLNGKAVVARRSQFMQLRMLEGGGSQFGDWFFGTAGSYIIDPASREFESKVKYQKAIGGGLYQYETDYHRFTVDARPDCIYLVEFEEDENKKVNFKTEKYCP